MKVWKVTPRGYCKGVMRAITMAKKTAQEHPDTPIYILGMLVHNRYVMEALSQLHIHCVDDKTKTRMELLDEIPKGSIVIFTAHGVAPLVKQKAQQLGLYGIDASCPDVVKTQDIVNDYLVKGYEILYIGKQQHPEAEAVLALSSHVHLITSQMDIEELPSYERVFVTNQTTMSIFDTEALFQKIQERFPQAILTEEICNATRIRQQAIADLDNNIVDLLYVVGDKQSNNSNRLAQIAKEQGIHQVYLIDDVYDITDEQLHNATCVAVTAGASTPTYLTNQVIHYLEDWKQLKEKPKVDIHSVL